MTDLTADAGLPTIPQQIDPVDLHITVAGSRRLVALEPDDHLAGWTATLWWTEWSDDGEPQEHRLATVDLWIVNPWDCPGGPLDPLDACSADTAVYMSLFPDGVLDPTVEHDFDVFSPVVLILDRVWVEPAWRGRGLGPLTAAAAIKQVGGMAGLAACYPSPFEHQGEKGRRAAQARVERLWSRFGFTEWQDGIWLLSLATSQLDDTHHELLMTVESKT